MKLGIITDIHNNLIALKAVLERFRQMQCDKIICCGDIIGIGPYPEETVQFIMQIPNLIAVQGNHERYLLEGMPKFYPNKEHLHYEEMKHHKWEHNLLSKKLIAFLKNLPYKTDMVCAGFRISVMHYCMDKKGNFINYRQNPTQNDLNKMFADVDADIILYGHNHCRNICKAETLYINVGSLGCPARDKNIARAGILQLDKKTAEIQTLDVEYDVNTVIGRIDEIHYPASDTIKKYFYGI